MKLRILLADDHEIVRQGVRTVLEGQPGWVVCGEARTGREAVAKAVELRPDIAVLDISMPRLYGMQALQQLKHHPRTSAIPVVAVSARVNKEQQDAVLRAGFSEVLLKPITPARILESVQRFAPLAGR